MFEVRSAIVSSWCYFARHDPVFSLQPHQVLDLAVHTNAAHIYTPFWHFPLARSRQGYTAKGAALLSLQDTMRAGLRTHVPTTFTLDFSFFSASF
jgi:hypothetical protein